MKRLCLPSHQYIFYNQNDVTTEPERSQNSNLLVSMAAELTLLHQGSPTVALPLPHKLGENTQKIRPLITHGGITQSPLHDPWEAGESQGCLGNQDKVC